MMVVEGSVRFIGKNLTLYGSKITYDLTKQQLEMQNARMITPEFSVVASYLLKKSDTLFYAKEAEFTTCRDCAESWKIFGKEIDLEIGAYVKVKHALMKVKGVDVLYFPYLVLPVKNARESGLLFPFVGAQNDEGLAYRQPFFWDINESEDLTFTPEFLARRGQGLDLQYRKIFSEKTWVELNSKYVNDKIYLPEKLNNNNSNSNFFRNFFELEAHYQPDLSLNQHVHIMGLKDLDFLRDFRYYTINYDDSSDIGLNYTAEKRFDQFYVGTEVHYKRNLVTPDPLSFDSSYVQVLPDLSFGMTPQVLHQSQSAFLYRIIAGADANVTLFRQNRFVEGDEAIRNAIRIDTKPYVEMSLFDFGPAHLKTSYSIDYQEYQFLEDEQKKFYKNAGLITTELGFSVDRIFGLAYEETYDTEELADEDLRKISKKENENMKNALGENVIGAIPKVEKTRTKEVIKVSKSSYRHSQDYKLIHYQILHDGETGNETFENQIQTEQGWFDFQDAIRADILNLASNEARTRLPLNNTLEFQWNNSLIKKSTRYANHLVDHKYLKDNFTYQKLGHFNISQGFLLDGRNDNLKNSLTRLHIDASYRTDTWYYNFDDFYNHQSDNHIFATSAEKKFERINLLAQYNFNSYPDSFIKTFKSGFQIRPIDAFGVSLLREFDLESNQNISSIFQVDFMPSNNCWILNLNYQENADQKLFAFQFLWNFGNEEFSEYKRDFFSFNRLQL